MMLAEVQVLPEIRVAREQPKILFIGGTHPRHLYYASEIHKHYPLVGRILVGRENMIPTPPDSISNKNAMLWKRHFQGRKNTEEKYFPPQNLDVYSYLFTHDLFGGSDMIDLIKEINPDIVLVFGCGMIRGELAMVLPELTINLHLGLSPRYRGAATLFWPFYFLEPQWAGCTFHKIVHEPDAGDILHQCVPVLEKGDKIHDVACKAVVKATDEMIRLLGVMNINPEDWWMFHKQTAMGKNFLARDFQPSHLRMIYETYNDNIVDEYLEGDLKQHTPKLVRQF